MSTTLWEYNSGLSSPSILEPLEVGICEIDPELVRILLQITEQDLPPSTCLMQPKTTGSNDDEDFAKLRESAQKDFAEWQRSRSRKPTRSLKYRHTSVACSTAGSSAKQSLCYYNSDPFHKHEKNIN